MSADLVHMDGKEVEDLLSGVLSPNEQNQQHSSGASNNLPPSSGKGSWLMHFQCVLCEKVLVESVLAVSFILRAVFLK